jgi:hypothetical protein
MTARGGVRLIVAAVLLGAIGSAAWSAAAPAAAAPPGAVAAKGPVRLRLKLEPGDVRQVQRIVRTESLARLGDKSRRAVNEIVVRAEETVVAWQADKLLAKLVLVETPSPERLVAYEEDGKDRLADYPQQARLRAISPVLATQVRTLRGELADRPQKVAEAMGLLDLLQAAMRVLPDGPVKPGDTWTQDLDCGIAQAKITTKFTGLRPEGEKAVPCAVLESTAAVTFGPADAQRLKIDKMEFQMAVALDGTGIVSNAGTASITATATDAGESRLVRTFEEKLVVSARLDAPQLEKVRGQLAQIEKAIEIAKTGDADGALAALDVYLKENPQGGWVPAVQAFRDGLVVQQLMAKPTSPSKLRLILRDLQAERDRLKSKGDQDPVDAAEKTIRTLVKVNAAAVLADAADSDPIVRDLAAFGLAFSEDPAAPTTLAGLAKDASAQVRGTAVVGLAILGKGLDAATFSALLGDGDLRVRGAAALLVSRTLKPDDALAATVLPLLARNLRADNVWTRANVVTALGAAAPAARAPAVAAALVAACKDEKEPGLVPVYLAALKNLTGKESATLAPYEEWVKQHPAKEPLVVTPTVPETPPAVVPTGVAPLPPPALPVPKTPGILAPPPPALPIPKAPGVVPPPALPAPKPLEPPAKEKPPRE